MDDRYNHVALLNFVMRMFQLKNDTQLAGVLGVHPPVISKIRHRRLPVGAPMLVRAHEVTGMSTRELRSIMGDHRRLFQIGTTGGNSSRGMA